MNLTLDVNIPVITVFVQGLLSFFSPCVLPLIPVYMGYLSGGTKETDVDGNVSYDRKKVFINTFFFVVGVSFAFFLLGFVMTTVGRFFSGNQILFARIGGGLVVLFGLCQLGIFGTSTLLGGEYRLPVRIEKLSASPLTALIMGFVLSFAWTPCVGPALSTVLIMASTAGSSGKGFILIAVYTLGYVIPFLGVGLFTTQLLDYLGRHRNIVKHSVKIGGALMILMGVLMLTGNMNRISGYMASAASGVTEPTEVSEVVKESGAVKESEVIKESQVAEESDSVGAESTSGGENTAKTEGPIEDGAAAENVSGGDNTSKTEGHIEDDTSVTENVSREEAANGPKDASNKEGENVPDEALAENENASGKSSEDEISEKKNDSDAESGENSDEETEDIHGSEAGEESDEESGNATDDETEAGSEDETEDDSDGIPAPDFSLTDQYGIVHNLSDYKGKILFLNFWATWCPPCRAELPHIQELYEEYQEAEDDSVAFVGVTFPSLGSETSVDGIKDFLDENGYTFTVLMDETFELEQKYYITSFPTTFIIDNRGKVLGYIPGSLTKEIIEDIISQAKEMSGMD